MRDKGRPYLDPDDWRQAQEAAVAMRIANSQRQQLKPMTPGQVPYFQSMDEKKITICIGPAGTGKTLCSCGRAAQLLSAGKVKKIILSRPLVACGKGYGFLPGDKREKIEHFMRPMLDYLREFMTPIELERRLKDGTVEMFPLDDMRGSTFKDSFVICDEGQNAEYHQLHMLLTRFGPGSKFVICGGCKQNAD